MSIPFSAGFTPSRWQTALDVMLEKDVGSPKITQFCIIAIVEGDMNAIMKVSWNCWLVLIAEGTGRTALDALLLKVVTMECLPLFRLNGAILNNDAIACYNCMIPK
eukprot:11837301-Ditylum_brightwellii.AAC.1